MSLRHRTFASLTLCLFIAVLSRYFIQHYSADRCRANWLFVLSGNGLCKLNYFFGFKKQRQYDMLKLYERVWSSSSGRHYMLGKRWEGNSNRIGRVVSSGFNFINFKTWCLSNLWDGNVFFNTRLIFILHCRCDPNNFRRRPEWRHP